jgi:hypothetical protein
MAGKGFSAILYAPKTGIGIFLLLNTGAMSLRNKIS